MNKAVKLCQHCLDEFITNLGVTEIEEYTIYPIGDCELCYRTASKLIPLDNFERAIFQRMKTEAGV